MSLGEDAADGGGVVDDGEGIGEAAEGVGWEWRKEDGDKGEYGGGGNDDDRSHLREWELMAVRLVPFIGGRGEREREDREGISWREKELGINVKGIRSSLKRFMLN